MSYETTSGILIRKLTYGDYDLILTFLTQDHGKLSVIAKSAKKSVKRFGGLLELFSDLKLVIRQGRKNQLAILQEVTLDRNFPQIRENIQKTAYASYWAELVHGWVEEGQNQKALYTLLQFALMNLNTGSLSQKEISILFQIRLTALAGFCPNMWHCYFCKMELEQIIQSRIIFDLVLGGIVCKKCASKTKKPMLVSKGTLKLLIWAVSGNLERAGKIRFSKNTADQGLSLLEAFVPFHFGRELKSLTILNQLRNE